MKNGMNVFKGVMTGIVIGGAAGMVAMSALKPNKKKMIKKKTANAIDTVGAIMQNIADCTR